MMADSSSQTVRPSKKRAPYDDQLTPHMTLLCPSDDVLRETLRVHDQKTHSTELLTHLSTCRHCQARITEWGQQSQYGSLVHRAGSHEIEYRPSETSNKQPQPTPEVRHGKPDSVTTGYEGPAFRRINNYDLIALIGTGGSANVYRGRHIHLHRPVAVKLLLEQYSRSEMARLRFFREMKSIGQLDHPYIVHAYDAGEWEGDLYLVMELVLGENVDSFSRRVGPMPVPDSCEIIRQAALGLQHIHENGLVHRDLKPSNLLISRHGIKIADLGLALVLDDDNSDHRLTSHQTVLGTADYMAPEQAEGSHDVDIRADLYSLGCTLFRLLSARAPYGTPEYDTPIKKMVAHASQPFPDIRAMRSDIPVELFAILEKLTAKNHAERYDSPLELAQALDPFCGDIDLGKLGITSPVQPVQRQRSETIPAQSNPPNSDTISRDATFVANRRARWSRGVVGAAVLALALAIVSSFSPRDSTTINQVTSASKVPQAPPDDSPLETPPQDPPRVEPVFERPRTKLEHQWSKLFGAFPEDLRFPGRVDSGADHFFSDPLGSLTVKSTDVVRMIQLGVLKEGDDSTISITVPQLPENGIFGIFAGLDMEHANNREPSKYHEFLIQVPIPETGKGLIQWGYASAHPTRVGWSFESQDAIDQVLEHPQVPLTLEVRLKPDKLSYISINRKQCVWRSPPIHRYSYLGSYGIIVRNGTFSFVTPECTRNRE